jgi:uncharacterized protein YjaZ
MIAFHLLNAHGKLDKYSTRLLEIGRNSVTEIVKHLPVCGVDVTFQFNPLAVIPEVGMSGFSPSAHLIQVSLDPDNRNFDAALEIELRATLAHELHHCLRWRGPGYGSSLREALVSEGLARDFETRFRPDRGLPLYHRRLAIQEINHLLQIVTNSQNEPNYNHGEWFFTGSEAKEIPPFAGYDLGLTIARGFIKHSGRDSSTLCDEPAESFYKQT